MSPGEKLIFFAGALSDICKLMLYNSVAVENMISQADSETDAKALLAKNIPGDDQLQKPLQDPAEKAKVLKQFIEACDPNGSRVRHNGRWHISIGDISQK